MEIFKQHVRNNYHLNGMQCVRACDFFLFQFGSNVTDHKIFAKLTQHWEKEFHEDMKALNVGAW